MDTGGGRALGNEVDRQRTKYLLWRDVCVLYTGAAGFTAGMRGEIEREHVCAHLGCWAKCGLVLSTLVA